MYYLARKTNEYLSEVISKYPNRSLTFADINADRVYLLDMAVNELEYAICFIYLLNILTILENF